MIFGYLKKMYEQVFNEEFSFTPFNILKMQQSTYLLQELGANIGDYRFVLLKNRPFSQNLLNEITSSQNKEPTTLLNFSRDAIDEINKLKNIFEKFKNDKFYIDNNYHFDDLVLCLSLCRYLSYVYYEEEDIINTLPLLNLGFENYDLNKHIFKISKTLFK